MATHLAMLTPEEQLLDVYIVFMHTQPYILHTKLWTTTTLLYKYSALCASSLLSLSLSSLPSKGAFSPDSYKELP